jgi:hypothetical protein
VSLSSGKKENTDAPGSSETLVNDYSSICNIVARHNEHPIAVTSKKTPWP